MKVRARKLRERQVKVSSRRPGPTLSSCITWPWVNERRKCPESRAPGPPPKTRPMPPCRSRVEVVDAILRPRASRSTTLAAFGRGVVGGGHSTNHLSEVVRSRPPRPTVAPGPGPAARNQVRIIELRPDRVRRFVGYEVPLLVGLIETSQSQLSLLEEGILVDAPRSHQSTSAGGFPRNLSSVEPSVAGRWGNLEGAVVAQQRPERVDTATGQGEEGLDVAGPSPRFLR